MTRMQKALAAGASSLALALLGVNGRFDDVVVSLSVAVVGLLTFVISIGALLSVRSGPLGPPHRYLGIPLGFAAGLHLFECMVLGPNFSFGWFAWTMSPHLLALALSCCGTTKVAGVAGTAAALLLDSWTFGRVFVIRESISIVTLTLVPFWNILFVVPGATLLAWFVYGRRAARDTL